MVIIFSLELWDELQMTQELNICFVHKSEVFFKFLDDLAIFCPDNWFIKEELHNRFNLISKERVKIFKHNSENLMKIGWKIRKLWHFEVSQIFTKHFLTSRYEYMQMSELMMSAPHYLPYILYIKFWKI